MDKEFGQTTHISRQKVARCAYRTSIRSSSNLPLTIADQPARLLTPARRRRTLGCSGAVRVGRSAPDFRRQGKIHVARATVSCSENGCIIHIAGSPETLTYQQFLADSDRTVPRSLRKTDASTDLSPPRTQLEGRPRNQFPVGLVPQNVGIDFWDGQPLRAIRLAEEPDRFWGMQNITPCLKGQRYYLPT